MGDHVRMGMIGVGYWGPHVMRNVLASPHLRLGFVCDKDESRLETIRAQHPSLPQSTDVADVFADENIDAVAIATPVGTHANLVVQALEAGKHVFVEKPMDTDPQRILELHRLAESRNLTLMVDHVYLYNPAIQKLVGLYRSGALGDLLYIDSVRINLGIFQTDVNVTWDLATHDIAIVGYLIGRKAVSVSAIGSNASLGSNVSMAHLHIDYGKGLIASVHVNWLSPVKLRHFLVGGSKQSVLYNDLDQSEPLKIFDRGVDVITDPEGRRAALYAYRSGDVSSPGLEKVEALQNSLNHFADCVVNGTTPLSSALDAYEVAAVLTAADRSMASGGQTTEVERRSG
jgi:predicted dehydrogenase